ncbi:hypothetical protein WHR41_02323 [Cladosporium halotolerans]|uniref:DUF1772-domain-containing protein n=1 Tax=Cladosporium halotolerans TaxID=1052096 RepID=A0AB34L1P6_9PEZI
MPPLNPRSGHFGLILPVCSSAATLGLSLFQFPLFMSFMQPRKNDTTKTTTKISGTPLSQFWASFLAPGAGLIAGLNLVSASAGLLSARWLREHETLETVEISRWYFYGAALALGHLAFVPAVAGLIKSIVGNSKGEVRTEAKAQESNEAAMRSWFLWHSLRTVVVDIPALWCFAEGMALSFWVI